MKYGEFLDEWMSGVKANVKSRTFRRYDCILTGQVRPQLGQIEIENLDAETMQRFVADLSRRYAANTVKSVVAVVRSSLAKAESLGIVGHNVMDKVELPRREEKLVECFSAAEQKKIEKFIETSGKEKYIGVLLCLYTGLRVGELLALEWQDIDFEKGLLTVQKSCHDEWRDGEYIKAIETPKTNASIRVIPIPHQLLPKLKGAKKGSKSPYVVSGKDGKEISVRSYQSSFELLLKRLSLPHHGFHALRHTFATRAIECGMDVRTLSELMGHTDPTVTLRRYAHSMMEHKRMMMNKLGKIFQ